MFDATHRSILETAMLFRSTYMSGGENGRYVAYLSIVIFLHPKGIKSVVIFRRQRWLIIEDMETPALGAFLALESVASSVYRYSGAQDECTHNEALHRSYLLIIASGTTEVSLYLVMTTLASCRVGDGELAGPNCVADLPDTRRVILVLLVTAACFAACTAGGRRWFFVRAEGTFPRRGITSLNGGTAFGRSGWAVAIARGLSRTAGGGSRGLSGRGWLRHRRDV